ncbi:CusA/CzcA family heavy metal efflux RND transporter [Fontisphaera persica]|uniref:efflux RND transporter permease subunit n=1 Tax=Fontisphaera persica TaxID=2974023 RepID=UPI0024C02EC2|nr:CusA/CzcA family heavy metal efflux RND transporter [Fontisphaera persica]WCJ59893.1 CusA/CzcA family heavy metal efflux RND transporter [Fontisphaera persica]
MLNWIISASLRNRLLVCVLAGVLVAVGIRNLTLLPIDAFPDTTPVQVQINTTAPALNPHEVEAQITIPVELAISGLPGLQNVRSLSRFGLSQVVATFDDRIHILKARQLITERLQTVELPESLERPQLGPIATGLGEVFHYLVWSTNTNRTLTELRILQDWVIKPELRKVRGVAEVNTWGGYEKQYHVVVETERLIKYRLTLEDLFTALQANNQNVGGGQIVRSGEALLVHGVGLTTNAQEIANIVIASFNGTPVRVGDVAMVKEDHEIRRGAVTANGRGEAVLGLGFMLMGENSAVVTRALKARLAEVQKSLPPDVKLEVLYDRTELVDKVIHTVQHNLLAGALLVIAVLFAFLGNLRAGLIVAAAIPLSMLFAGNLMLQTGIAASLLSLGAIDFGLIVDSSVIMVENCARHAARHQDRPWMEVIREAALEVRQPTLYGELIILVVFLPVLTLEGIEGKLFRPMALTMIFALLGSLVLSLVLMPVLASLLLSRHMKTTEPWVVRAARWCYAPVLDAALRHRGLVLAMAVAIVAGGAWLATRMGGEFLPKLGEGAIVATSVRLAGISVDESVAQNHQIEQRLLAEFPDEIEHVWTRLGTAEVATDPMGVELADFFLALKPREQWQKARTQAELIEKLREVLNQVPGLRPAFSQPIEMRMNEMIAGARGDLAIKIYGDDLEELRRLGHEVQSVLARIRGASEIAVEQLTGQTFLQVRVNPEAVARYGVPARHVLNVVEAVGSRRVGEVREGQRRFPLVVRLPDTQRQDPQALAATLIPTAAGPVLPLQQLANLTETEGPSTINREWGRRRITVQCNVQGRDVKSFVAEARESMEAQIKLPPGYSMEWGGQFENMERANRKLMFVVPLALALVFILLFFSLKSLRDVLIVATGIPLGAVGGVLSLWLRDMPFTVSAGIGFVALSGVAILNGLVLVTFIRQQWEQGMTPAQAVREGCLARLRPVLMTALVAAVGFLPMAINVGVGGEVQRPLATVVIGGIFTNTLLTLVVLPVLYATFCPPRQNPATLSPAG